MKKLAVLSLSCAFLFNSMYASADPTSPNQAQNASHILSQWIEYELSTRENQKSPTNQKFATEFSDSTKDLNGKQVKGVIKTGIQTAVRETVSDPSKQEGLAQLADLLTAITIPQEIQWINQAFPTLKAAARQMNRDETTEDPDQVSLSYSDNIKESMLFGLVVSGTFLSSPSYDTFGLIEGWIESVVGITTLPAGPLAQMAATTALKLLTIGVSYGTAAAVNSEAQLLKNTYVKDNDPNPPPPDTCQGLDPNSHECHCKKEPQADDCTGQNGGDNQDGGNHDQGSGSDKKDKSNKTAMTVGLGLLASGAVTAYGIAGKESDDNG